MNCSSDLGLSSTSMLKLLCDKWWSKFYELEAPTSEAEEWRFHGRTRKPFCWRPWEDTFKITFIKLKNLN